MGRLLRPARTRGSPRGFTLIELVVVLAVIGILLSIAVPIYAGYRKRAYKEEVARILQEVKTLTWAYYNEFDRFPSVVGDIGMAMPSGSAWDIPAVTAGGGSGATFVTWTSSGLPGGALVEPADLCSVTLSDDGAAGQGCNF